MYKIRSTTKSILSLLAILFAYGVVGRMDYDDAVMMENAQKQAVHPDCLVADSTSSTSQIQALPTGQEEFPDAPEISPANPCNILIY
jgi:hypothetical protein